MECTVVSVGDDRTLTVDAAGYAGVVPCGELAWGEPSATFVPGQRLSAVILQIDYEDLSLALSLRYAEGIPPADMPLRIGEAHRVRITDVRTAARKMPEQLTVESVEMPALRGVIFARDLAWEPGRTFGGGLPPGRRDRSGCHRPDAAQTDFQGEPARHGRRHAVARRHPPGARNST